MLHITQNDVELLKSGYFLNASEILYLKTFLIHESKILTLHARKKVKHMFGKLPGE